MPYMKRTLIRRLPPRGRRRGMGCSAMGDFTDSDQCSTIPLGDPYRKPGNYCATPDGGTTTFNADGTTYRQPGYTVDPDPAHPAGTGPGGSATTGAGTGSSFLDSLLKVVTTPTPPTVIAPVSTGLSTTTAIALAGGAILLALMLSRN